MAETVFFLVHGKRLRRKLKDAGAVSESTAKTISELDLDSREIRTLKRNVWAGRVKQVLDKNGENKYYVRNEG